MISFFYSYFSSQPSKLWTWNILRMFLGDSKSLYSLKKHVVCEMFSFFVLGFHWWNLHMGPNFFISFHVFSYDTGCQGSCFPKARESDRTFILISKLRTVPTLYQAKSSFSWGQDTRRIFFEKLFSEIFFGSSIFWILCRWTFLYDSG